MLLATEAPRFSVYTRKDLDDIPELRRLGREEREAMKAVAAVLPFRVNRYVIEELIDWDAVPDDPLFQLTFPQRGMLAPEDFERMRALVARGVPRSVVVESAREIQRGLNPHPAGQTDLNVPRDARGRPLHGMQHKYRETVLFFPSAGQTCHTYCTYCFRWPQFVSLPGLKLAAREASTLTGYLRTHREVSSVLITGGDPLVMSTRLLRKYVEPLLAPDLEHVGSIRIGTKAPVYWPFRFTAGEDAQDLLRLFEEVRASGRTLALMVHYCHPRELGPAAAREALRCVQDAGAEVRCQAPLVRHVNDDPDVWAELLELEVRLGAHPYYMFVERDTGARGYFEVPLARAFEVFTTAYRRVTGLARTIRGPSMSCTPGKVLVDGVVDVQGQSFFALQFLQGRDPAWVNRVFLAEFDPEATWIDQLRPAFGAERFFFEPALAEMRRTGRVRPWLDRPAG